MASKKKTEAATPQQAEPVTPKHEPGLKIIAMQVENIKKVSFARIIPKGDVVVVSGPNGSGKSSILDAVEWGMTGVSNVPTQPIKKGQNVGKISIDLGDYKLTRHFTRVDPEKSEKGLTFITKLVLEGKNRETFKSPQTLLDSFMGKISFDPLQFLRMDDKQQLETLRGLVTLDVDLDQLEAEKKTAYDARRDAGRDVDSASARLQAMQEPEEGLPEVAIDTAEITKKLEGAANHNSIVASQLQAQARKREEAEQLGIVVDNHKRQIANLEQQILQLREAITAAQEQGEKLIAEAATMEIGAEISTAEVAAELQAAQKTNGAIQRREAYLSVKAQVTEAEKRWTAHDTTVKAKETERAAAIARAKMPIAGLGIGAGEVLFDELPFSQASNAKQIEVSVSLAMASNPKLRILRIKDGSLLDDKSLQQIVEMAAAGDYQIWIERISAEGSVGVVMEDGEAHGDEVEQVKR